MDTENSRHGHACPCMDKLLTPAPKYVEGVLLLSSLLSPLQEASRCLVEHIHRIELENQQLHLISRTWVLLVHQGELEEQRQQLLRESQYAEDLKRLHAHLTQTTNRVSACQACIVENHPYHEGLGPSRLGCASGKRHLQQEQMSHIKELEKELRAKHSDSLQSIKTNFLQEKEASRCLVEHIHRIELENQQLHLISRTWVLLVHQGELEEQRQQLLRESQYAEDLKRLHAHLTQTTNRVSACQACIVENHPYHEGLGPSRLGCASGKRHLQQEQMSHIKELEKELRAKHSDSLQSIKTNFLQEKVHNGHLAKPILFYCAGRVATGTSTTSSIPESVSSFKSFCKRRTPRAERRLSEAMEGVQRSQEELNAQERNQIRALLQEFAHLFTVRPEDGGQAAWTKIRLTAGTPRPVENHHADYPCSDDMWPGRSYKKCRR
ncbi:UNVERIFIED_CONTAM: hypothetical protein FKN15_077317 [Acipenser sinensis]